MEKPTEIKKDKKKGKAKKILTNIGMFLALFGVSAAATYFAIPTNTFKTNQNGQGSGNNSSAPAEEGLTPTEQLITNLTATATNGIDATLDANFVIPGKTDTDNVISLSGATVKFAMASLSDITLEMKAPLTYNGRKRELDVTLKDHKLYFGVSYLASESADENNPVVDYDVKYYVDLTPVTYNGSDGKEHTYQLGDIDYAMAHIFNSVADSDSGVTVVTDTTTSSDSTSSFDANALLEVLGNMPYVSVDGGYMYYLNLTKDLIGIDLPINIFSDASYNLTGITLPGQAITGTSGSYTKSSEAAPSAITLDNGMSFSAKFACTEKAITVTEPANASSYHRLTNSLGIFDKIAEIAKTPKFGVAFKGLTDTSDFTLSHEVKAADTASNTAAKNESSTLSLSADVDYTDKNALKVHAGLGIAAKDDSEIIQTKKVVVDYLSGDSYLNYNDILKASMSKTVLDDLISRVKSSPIDLGTDSDKTSEQLDKIFGFVTQSKVITALKDGHYESMLDMVTGISYADNQILLTVDLAPIGISGQVVVAVDATGTTDSPVPLASISFKNIILTSFTINGKIVLDDYSTIVTPTASEYSAWTKLPDLYDQVYALTQSKKATVSLSGDVFSSTACTGNASQLKGFSFSGKTDFDVNQDTTTDTTAKSGSGNLVIKNYTDTYVQDYKVGIDVVGEDQMYFSYNDYEAHSYNGTDINHTDDGSKKLVGKFGIQTLNDIISLVSKLIGSNDARFTKFGDMLSEMMATSIVGSLVSNNLNSLITNKILVSSSVNDDLASFTITKELLGTDSDFTVTINYEGGKLKTFALSNFVMSGKTINCKLSLDAYGDTFDKITQQVSDADRAAAWDFSKIQVLLQYGINAALFGTSSTSSVSTYHLTASGSAKLGLISLDAISFDLYLYIDGANVKMKGNLTLPIITGLNSVTFQYKDWFGVTHSSTPLGGTRKVDFYYESSASDLGGMMYMNRTDSFTGKLIPDDKIPSCQAKKTTGKDFLSNIGDWLLQYFLGLDSNMMAKVTGTSDSSSAPQATYMEDVITGFTYNEANTSWDLTMDLGALAHTNILKGLTLTIKGDKDVPAAASGTEGMLRYLDATMIINVGFNISVNFSAEIENFSSTSTYVECWSDVSSAFDSYLTAHEADAISTSYSAY